MEDAKVGKKKKVKLIPMIFLMYMFISGGSFGIEDMVGGAGPGITLICLLVLPIVWAYPYGFVCTELGAKYPEVNGMYGWIKKALGNFPAYMAGWSMALANYVDTAVYMVISMEYVNSALGLGLSETQRWLLGLAFIAVICLMCLRGIEVLAASATVSGIILLTPFILTIIMGIPQIAHNPFTPLFGTGDAIVDTNEALLIGLWMFMGYESLHSFSDEVEGSGPLLSKAFMWAVPIATVVYIVPTFIGLAVTGNWSDWSTAGPIDFIEMGRLVGGNFLMLLFLIAGVFGNLSMYANYMAFGAEVTSQMAEDKRYFRGLDKEHPKHGTPYVAIIVSAVITAVLSKGSFADLVVIDVILLLIPVILMMLSGIVLRHREAPGTKWDCFEVKGGNVFFYIMAALPIIVAGYAIATAYPEEILAGAICLLIGAVLYNVFPKMYKKEDKEEAEEIEA